MSDKTIDLLRRLLRERPRDVETRMHLAELLRAVGDSAGARKEAEETLRLKPDHGPARTLLASILYDAGSDAQAAEHLERAIKGRPDDAEAHLLLARVLVRKGESARAEEHYEQAIALRPDLEDGDLQRAIARPQSAERVRVTAQPAPAAASTFEAEAPSLTFADVGGMEEVKESLRMNILLPLQKPEMFRGYGKKAGGGILMYGPPGCGKTHLARATAGECHARFFAVGLPDILDMYIGQSEKNLQRLFAEARANAPAIIFLDEIDALGSKRGDLSTAALRGTVNTLLMELDRLSQKGEPVLVIGATNTPWSLDTALKRPGRFDRIVFVPPPDLAARVEILTLHLKDKPARDVEVPKVAAKLERYSGADLRAVVDHATEAALKQALKSGKTVPLTTKMLLEAAGKVKPSTAEWLATARDYAKYSNEGGQYDAVTEYLKQTD